MPFLIDGHNLIPKIGLQLDSVDDELQLLELLQEHSRHDRSKIEVYFDGAPVDRAGSRQHGRVTAVFVSHASNADAAIRRRLRNLRGDARNWIVVSSDREVLGAAKAAGARTETSEEFAARVRLKERTRERAEKPGWQRGDEPGVSDEDVRHWLEIFKRGKT